MFRLLISTH